MREKLIELLKLSPNCICDLCGEKGRLDEVAEIIADNLIANGVTIQKWIPVTERLPEQGQEVIVCFGNHPTAFATAMMFWSETHLNWQNATYWMPLPEPPSEERRTDA